MNHVYKVPIIPENLNREETIIQVAEVLNHLNNVTDDIFKHITNRIESGRKKLSDISIRLDRINSKIVKLKGAKKATQVFSSSKYPASDINQQYISIFHDVKPPELTRHKVKHKKVTNNEELSDKLFLYHVKVKNHVDGNEVNGLGEIPDDINCVNDLLLYNSGKNLYKNFVMSDVLDNTQNTKEQEILNNSNIGAAPLSISERSILSRSSIHNFFYTPNLGEVPSLDVPLDLPDLPNIADDLRYDSEVDRGIAPSVVTSPNLPELPKINPVEVIEEIVEVKTEVPPETVTIPEEPIKIEEKKETVDLEPIIVEKDKKKNIDREPPQQLDVRASLMEAIRKAGGGRSLKSAANNNVEDTNKNSGGGDLMADLHAKLLMRRKGISGTKKQETQMDAHTALGKISAMIPPPIASISDKNETEDEDWDD